MVANKYKRIESKKDLDEWLDYEDKLYSDRNIRYRLLYFFQVSERTVLHKHQRLLRRTEYHTNCGHRLIAAFYQWRLNRMQNRYALHIPINTCGKDCI